MEQSVLHIGEVASRAGVSIDAVRYYEKHKLLPKAARSGSGYRLFPVETIDRVKFIKQAQEVGFSLSEIRNLFSTTSGFNQCQLVHDLLMQKLSEIDERIRQMKDFHSILKRHLNACEEELVAHREDAVCPVVVTIEKT